MSENFRWLHPSAKEFHQIRRFELTNPGLADPMPLSFDPNKHLAFNVFGLPRRITAERFRSFLVSAVRSGASDITLQTDIRPRIEINGTLFRLAGRSWSQSEIEDILTETYGAASGTAEVQGRKTLDYSYEFLAADGIRHRFRINATGIRGRNESGIELTLRALPDIPPHISEVGLSSDEVNAMTPRTGLVVIAGATGSGKSSTMAALTRFHLENAKHPVKIVDIQAPIEFTYHQVLAQSDVSASVIGQSEVGRHITDFANGVRSALRRKPHIINVGEARDQETIRTALEAALTGHLVYTTTHAGSVQDCVRRLLAPFSHAERAQHASDLGACLQFVMVQQLIPDKKGGRVAVREWMNFSDDAGRAMIELPPDAWPRFILACMTGHGEGKQYASKIQTFSDCASLLSDRGVLSKQIAREFKQNSGIGNS